MKEYLIVDGYNIIGAWPELQELKENNLEHARARLIEILAVHAALSKRKVIVVFDAYQVKKNNGSQEIIQGIEVIYTKENVTADMAIERLTAQIPKHEKVYVIKDYKGRIAVFYDDNHIPKKIFDIYTDSLPEDDANKIKTGISLTEKELNSVIADYTS